MFVVLRLGEMEKCSQSFAPGGSGSNTKPLPRGAKDYERCGIRSC